MHQIVSRLIDKITEWLGHPVASVLAVVLVTIDLVYGWQSGWPSTWINANGAATGLTAIILLVFLQHSTNRGNRALHAKLDAQIAVDQAIDNRLIGSEALAEAEIRNLQKEAVQQVQETLAEAEGIEDDV